MNILLNVLTVIGLIGNSVALYGVYKHMMAKAQEKKVLDVVVSFIMFLGMIVVLRNVIIAMVVVL